MIMLYLENGTQRGLTSVRNCAINMNANGTMASATFNNAALNPIGGANQVFDATDSGELGFYYGAGYHVITTS